MKQSKQEKRLRNQIGIDLWKCTRRLRNLESQFYCRRVWNIPLVLNLIEEIGELITDIEESQEDYDD